MWRAPSITAYTNEKALQQLLSESPGLLPGVETETAVAAREVYVPGSGPADLVCVDVQGAVTICECKLQDNPDIRRTIVGQAFAYAAGLWRMTYEDFDHVMAARLGQPIAEALSTRSVSGEVEWDEELFRSALASTLREGAFRLVFVVDSITNELRRIVEFVNDHTSAAIEVLALELGYVAHDSVEILTPTIYGQEAAHQKATRRRSTTDSSSGGGAPTSVEVIVAAGAIADGTALVLRPERLDRDWGPLVKRWAAKHVGSLEATWRSDPRRPLVWSVDGEAYSPNGVTRRIVEQAGGRWAAFQATKPWVVPSGESLVEIAARLRAPVSPSTEPSEEAP